MLYAKTKDLVAYILVGVPGSGKSTWVEKHKTPGTIICSTDNYIESYAKEVNKTYSDVFAEYIAVATSRMLDDLVYAKEYDFNVIWDQSNVSVKTRAKKIKMLPQYKKIAVVFSIPEKEEHIRRLESRPGKDISYHAVARMIKQFVVPTIEEGFDEIIFTNNC